MANFGFESTTDDVRAGQDLSGKTAVVTGGTSAVGWETARALSVAGAHVVITARDATKADEATGSLREAAPAGVRDEASGLGLKAEKGFLGVLFVLLSDVTIHTAKWPRQPV